MSVMISFFVSYLKNSFIAYISEIEDRTENFVKEYVVHNNTAVFINYYVCMTVMVNLLASQLKDTYSC